MFSLGCKGLIILRLFVKKYQSNCFCLAYELPSWFFAWPESQLFFLSNEQETAWSLKHVQIRVLHFNPPRALVEP
jgi:hypothetical protein